MSLPKNDMSRGASSRSIIREHELTSSTVVSPMAIPHAPDDFSVVWQLREWAASYLPTFADKHALVLAEIAHRRQRSIGAEIHPEDSERLKAYVDRAWDLARRAESIGR